MQSMTISEIPNAENLVEVVVNLQDMLVEFRYKGYERIPYTQTFGELVSSPDTARYDGELDDPEHPRPVPRT